MNSSHQKPALLLNATHSEIRIICCLKPLDLRDICESEINSQSYYEINTKTQAGYKNVPSHNKCINKITFSIVVNHEMSKNFSLRSQKTDAQSSCFHLAQYLKNHCQSNWTKERKKYTKFERKSLSCICMQPHLHSHVHTHTCTNTQRT